MSRIVVALLLAAGCGTGNPCKPLDQGPVGCQSSTNATCGCPATWAAAQDPAGWITTVPYCTSSTPTQPYDDHPVLQQCERGSIAYRQGVDASMTCSYDASGNLIRVDNAVITRNACWGEAPVQPGACDAGVDLPLCRVPDANTPCDVFTRSPCLQGQKCTWIYDTDQLGHVGCVGAGTAGTGSGCTRTPPGATGADDCVAGDFCFGPAGGGAGTCQLVCNPSFGAAACSGTTCTTHDGVFGQPGQVSSAGLCQ